MELSGSQYLGQTKNGRLEGEGKYLFANGNYYVGELKDGMFHGKGTLYFYGSGSFEAEWKEGIAVQGKYTFSDGLKFQPENQPENWDYCTAKDRRFYVERLSGIKP